ncbi:hypothetical protein SAMN05660350_03448 [Geodermatophilus obscurus]|uniref:Matrixin n=1 Tax=Geodermatophilus obscurus TaxID=1861 RepID=A0A1M7UKZ7_9ACTN|nr:hypothetical protein [Geodermatophilus obscurus]SHN83604.1 hypothetical protein SAMN05660350_03448 [Geodermatophilus obscurus]
MTAPSPRSLAGGAAAYSVDAGRVPDPHGPPPPLPDGLPFLARDYRAGLGDTSDSGPITPTRTLRGGCYYMRYTPLQTSSTRPGAVYYLGSLRVQRVGTTLTVSGDLYLRHVSSGRPADAAGEPDPADGIPVLPRADYRYYVRVTRVSDSPGAQESFTLTFELFRFNAAITAWTNEGVSTVQLSWTTAPSGFPSGADYLTGDVENAAGAVTGTLSLGWVSPFLRRSTLEVDRVPGGVAPRTNGSDGYGWRQVFEPVGWDLTVVESDDTVAEPSGESWGDAEMHAAMLEYRDRREALLDVEWRYHLLCVRRLDETERGIMYDSSAVDLNGTAREGVGIACDWVYEQDDPSWGPLRGTRFGDDLPTYFRTAVHELGHAMGLYHNASDNGFMNTTDVIARRAHAGRPFPQNIRWAFHPDDEKRLRHMPDVWVRPGGIQFGEDYSVAPIAADDLVERPPGLRLEVCPVEELLPLGAPARVEFALVNESTAPVLVPASLGLRGGTVRGKVIDPAGTVRTFLPLVPCVESQPLRSLEPGERLSSAATVTHGPQGALLPSAGLHRIVVEVRWDEGGTPRALSGSATLLVTAATSGEQERAAYGILSTPDTLLAIAATADVGNGFAAIEQAASDPTLGPHYAWLDAKRALRSRATADEPSRRALERLAGDDVVVSSAERRRAVEALDRVEARYGVREEAIRHGEVTGTDDAPDTGSLRKLAAAARRRMDEGGRPR